MRMRDRNTSLSPLIRHACGRMHANAKKAPPISHVALAPPRAALPKGFRLRISIHSARESLQDTLGPASERGSFGLQTGHSSAHSLPVGGHPPSGLLEPANASSYGLRYGAGTGRNSARLIAETGVPVVTGVSAEW